MKRFLTLVLKLILSLLLLLAVLLVSLPLLVDPNDYKAQISEQFRVHTGRELSIPGDIRLSVFPWLGLKLGEVSLANAPGFGGQPFARVEQVDVRIRLLPLLRREVQVGRLTLRGLRLHLQRDAGGRDNWADLLPAAEPEEKSAEKPAPPAPKTPAEQVDAAPAAVALAALSIGGVSIENASLHWDDARSGQRYRLDRLNLETGPISLSEPVSLRLGLDLDSKAPAATARLALETRLHSDLQRRRFTLAPLQAVLDYRLEKAADRPALEGQLRLQAQLLLQPEKQKYTLSALELENDSRSAALPGGRLQAQLQSKKLRLNLAQESLRSDFVVIRAHGLEIQARFNIRDLLTKPRYLASVDLREFSPRRLLTTLGMADRLPPMADDKALSRARLGLRIIGGTDDLLLKPMILQLDDSNLQGYVSVTGFSRPALRYKLVLDRLDLDRYLPPANATGGSGGAQEAAAPARVAATPAVAAAGSAAALPQALLRSLDINGQLRIGRLKAANLRLAEVVVGTRAEKGLIRLKPLSARLYQGRYEGDIRLDARGDIPRVRLDERLEQVAIGPLLRDLLGDDRLRGTATLRAELGAGLYANAAGGLDLMALRRSLDGQLRFVFENGVVKGFNIAQYERELKARLKKQPPPENKAPRETDFARIEGSAKIRRGQLDNRDLRAALPHARVRGLGRVDLVREQLDYRLDVKFISAAEGQGGKSWERINKPPLPVYIRGPFAQPRIEVDYESLLKALARRELKKQEQKARARVREEKQKLKQKAGEELKQEEEKIRQKAEDALKKLLKF